MRLHDVCRSGFVLVGLAALSLACAREEASDVLGNGEEIGNQEQRAPTMGFETWCTQWSLENCDAVPATTISQELWTAGLDVFSEVVISPSRLNLSREDFMRTSVKGLIATFGGSGIFAFLNQLPWQRMNTELGRIILTNAAGGGSLTFNGLKIIAAERVELKPAGSQTFTLTGLSIQGANQTAPVPVTRLDLSTVGVLSLQTGAGLVQGIPLEFFSLGEMIEPVDPTPQQIVKAISAVAFDEGLDWRSKIRLTLLESSTTRVVEIVKRVLPSDSPMSESVGKILSRARGLVVGGEGAQVVSVSFANPVKCKMKVRNIPILGSLTVTLNLARGVGLQDLTRVQADVVKARIYGVKTSVGEVRDITFEGERAKLRVGAFTIPIDYTSEGSAEGSGVDSMTCEDVG